MKYQCVYCKEIFDEQNIIIVGVHSGWKFPTSTIMCADCLKAYQKSQNSCVDCKYFKNERRFRNNEQCKSCKNKSNWEEKPCNH